MKTVVFFPLFLLLSLAGRAQLLVLSPKANPEPQEYYIQIKLQDELIDKGKEHKVQYGMSVKYLSADEGSYRVQVDRVSDVFVDGKQSNLSVAYNLSVRTSSTLYPMLLDVSMDGKIESIVNYADIQLRWEKLKSDLREIYTGEGLERYFDCHNYRFEGQRDMISRLQNDCFTQFFFSDIYHTHQVNKTEEATYYIPFIYSLHKPVEYAAKRIVSSRERDGSTIYIEAWGEYADKRSIIDLVAEQRFPTSRGPMPEGTCRIYYYLDSKYHTIGTIFATAELEIDRVKKMSISISGNYEGRGNIKWEQTKYLKASDGKIDIPRNIFEGENEDIINQLNPLIKASFVNQAERKHEGIKIK